MKQVLTPHLLWLPSEKGATKSPSSNSLSLRFNSSTGLQQRKQQFLRNNPRNSLSRNHYSYLPRVYCRKEDKNACFLVFTWKGLDSILYKLLPEYPTSNDHTSRYWCRRSLSPKEPAGTSHLLLLTLSNDKPSHKYLPVRSWYTHLACQLLQLCHERWSGSDHQWKLHSYVPTGLQGVKKKLLTGSWSSTCYGYLSRLSPEGSEKKYIYIHFCPVFPWKDLTPYFKSFCWMVQLLVSMHLNVDCILP